MRNLSLILLILSLSLVAWAPVLPAAPNNPTAPPPPVGPSDTPEPPSPPDDPGDDDPTDTPRPTYQAWPTRTPTITPTPLASFTPTPTETPTPTVTPILTFLRVQVFVDSNKDGYFNPGEGVQGLWVTAQSGSWSAGALTQDGEVLFTTPGLLTSSGKITVQIPYLHLAEQVSPPRNPGETAVLAVRLEPPKYPAFLP